MKKILIIALSTNIIAGAGIDVYEKEPLPADHKLRFLPNTLLLPHLGYVTAENYSLFYTQMLDNFRSVCKKANLLELLQMIKEKYNTELTPEQIFYFKARRNGNAWF